MSSVPGSVGKSLHSNPFLSKNDAIMLQNEMMDLNVVTEDDALRRLLVWDLHIRKRVQEWWIGQQATSVETRNRHTYGLTREKPSQETIKSYPLDHTEAGTKNLLVKTAVVNAVGGGVETDGTFRITISDQARLNPTDKISISGLLYIPVGIIAGDIIKKDNQYHLYISAANTLSFRIFSGGSWKTPVNLTFTDDVWFSFTACYKSGGQAIYLSTVLQDSDSETGAIGTSANALGILHDGAGSAILGNLCRIGLLTLEHEYVPDKTGWLSSFHTDYHLDTKVAEEITTYEFIGHTNPTPNATLGGF